MRKGAAPAEETAAGAPAAAAATGASPGDATAGEPANPPEGARHVSDQERPGRGFQAPGTRWFSLRRRLLGLLLTGVTLGWAATLALSYQDAHHEIDEIFDANLVQVAQLLLALASEYDDDDDIAHMSGDFHKYQKKIVFQLWNEDGYLLLRSRHAPRDPLTNQTGFSENQDQEGRRWRYFSQWDEGRDLRAVVAEDHEVRQELAGHIAGRLLVPALLGLPLLAGWIWFAIRQGLAPVAAIAAQVAEREPQHLVPITPSTAPTELRPLLAALNHLLGRIDQALDNERRFTADAAHELRTPLAALAIQAQVAARARDAAERDHALALITASSRRAGHLVEQLLTLARLDPTAPLTTLPVHLDRIAAEVCADQAGGALARDIRLELEDRTHQLVAGNTELLRTLLRNLVDNALRYTPPGGQVLVAIDQEHDRVRLSVRDSGPGIPVDQRALALKRFHRLAGQEIAGSGLGLSIVARIADLHGARLELGDGLRGESGSPGLGVSISFPPAPEGQASRA
jgi:two-component system sensor histidine kinase QseC